LIAIIDYEAGNLKSVYNAFEAIGHTATVTSDPVELKKAAAIVLPGVGAFGEGMEALRRKNVIDALNEEVLVKKKPYLGICLGMQFLAGESEEIGTHSGLAWLNSQVKRIQPDDVKFKIPHMGWNNVEIKKRNPLFEKLEAEPVFYFVHSYYLDLMDDPTNSISSTCWHGATITASVQKQNIFGVQFHPEKSQQAGLHLLENFVNLI
jgi:glutamine amidotransferase